MAGWEGLTALLPALALFGLEAARRRPDRGRALLLAIFWLYVCAVFHYTGAGTLADMRRYLLREGAAWNALQVNLRLFSQAVDPVGYALNVALFVPFGALASRLWPGRRLLLRAAGGGLAFSLLIELSQLLNSRRTDVDDLLMNTAGAVLAAACTCCSAVCGGVRPRAGAGPGRAPYPSAPCSSGGSCCTTNSVWPSCCMDFKSRRAYPTRGGFVFTVLPGGTMPWPWPRPQRPCPRPAG